MCRNCRFLTSFSSRYLGKARKRSLRSERCSVEKSGTKTSSPLGNLQTTFVLHSLAASVVHKENSTLLSLKNDRRETNG